MNLVPVSIAMLILCIIITLTGANDPTNYFTGDISINCGSIGPSAALNGRKWIGDVLPKSSSWLQIIGSSTTSAVIHKQISDPIPQKTARISRFQFSYAFQLNPGQKIIRLHFNPAPYKGFKGLKDLLTVEAGPFTLLSNFSASLTAGALGVNSFTKEFCLNVQENQQLSITFSPASSQSGDDTYAFINGIEIIPMPARLSYFHGGEIGVQVVGHKSLVYVDHRNALEIIHQQNIKLNPVPSSGDSDEIFPMWANPGSKYNTWKIPVDVGFKYMIRIYFSELGLKIGGTRDLMFKVLINDMIADTNIDIVNEKSVSNIPRYRDYVVIMRGQKKEGKRDILISMHLHDELTAGHGLLAGFEILKLSNPDNSLASENPFLPPAQHSPSQTIQTLLSVLGQRKAIPTVAVIVICLVNIIVHKLREFWEASHTEEKNKPSIRAERVCRRFSLTEIQLATRNFSDSLLIGRGGFGKVYRGLIDKGQHTVAIKRLKSNSSQGAHEFLTEIEMLSELRHVNLVSLIGYCNENGEMILVYEYMACGTLADHLYKLPTEINPSFSLSWKQRLNICIGAGRGLDYLHTGHGIIHRDVKASNVLLDANFVAKVSDFGLAKLEDKGKLQSHVSTKIKGTRGYMDPFYVHTSKLTRKSDTYAFGVILFEVLCGRSPVDFSVEEDEQILIKWAQDNIRQGEINKIVASSLVGEISPDSLQLFVEVAEKCLHDEPKKRPTMAQVVLQLEFVLEQQENGKFSVPDQVTGVASTGMETVTSPPREENNRKLDNTTLPAGKKDGRKLKIHTPLRLWSWDAFWNRVKPFKKKGFISVSEICEADIKVPKFDLATIAAATDQFSIMIGRGAYGSVYKAVLPTGQIVAVKRFSSSRPAFNEIKSEILLVTRLLHRNIIKIVGYCIDEGAMLLYEFMENGRLDTYIFDEVRRRQLQWSLRFKIIMGVAEGISYLHQDSELKIIHRDLKPSNILLDIEMNPKVSGFDIAKTFEEDQSEVRTRIAGTMEYMSPEYLLQGRLTDKADVYAFGGLVLEILSGKKHRGCQSLIDKAWELWNEGTPGNLVDESIMGEFPHDEMLRCIQVGLLCTQHDPKHRPTMPSVLQMLLGEDLCLHEKMEKCNRESITSQINYSTATFEYDDTMQR